MSMTKKYPVLIVALLGLIVILTGCIQPKTETTKATIPPLDHAKITAIKTNLGQVPGLVTADIKVEVRLKKATLKGTVKSEELKKKAEQIAYKVEGITEVENKLEVKP